MVTHAFRLARGSFTLTSALSSILGDYKVFVLHYYDDIIIFSRNREEHLEHLKLVFQVLAEYGLHVNIGKCQIFLPQVLFLGHRVNGQGTGCHNTRLYRNR